MILKRENPAIWISLELAFPTSFPLLANSGGTSTFETERSNTKREGMETAIAATASSQTADYDDSKKVWPSLPWLRGLSFRGGYCIPLPVVCFRTGPKGQIHSFVNICICSHE